MACFSYKNDLYLSSVEMGSSKNDYLTKQFENFLKKFFNFCKVNKILF